jgi:hypothetical protein
MSLIAASLIAMGGALICRNARSVISKTVSQLDHAAAALSFEQLDTVSCL